MKTDLLIIGSGPGGYKSAVYAARQGLNVTVAERGPLGGTCLNCGCIPTKSLVHDASLLRFPDDVEGLYEKAIERKNSVVESLRSGVEMLFKQSGITLLQGTARFKDSRHVLVGDEEVEADNILIATGSKTKMLNIPGLDSPALFTSEQLLECKKLPYRLCIIGAGVIGMEMASIFASFGTEVTVVEFLKECLPTMDQEIAKRLRKLMEKRGVKFILQSAVTRIEGSTVVFNNLKKQQEGRVDADAILMAVGREPNVEGLDLDSIGVEYNKKGIVVNENMQTNVPHVFAIGDVNGRMMLAHAATFQGYRAVNLILGRTDNIRLDLIPSAVFTQPEAATVGLTDEQCKEKGIECKVYKGLWRANGRALAMNAPDGLIKLVVNSDDEIIGCHAFGAESATLIQEVTSLMNFHAKRQDLSQIVHIHPTISEILLDVCMD